MKTVSAYFILGLIWLLSAMQVKGQNQSGSISIPQHTITVKEHQLHVNLDIDISRLDIKSNEGIILTPILQASEGMKRLPEVIVNRRNRNISYDRRVSHPRQLGLYHAPYTVVKINKQSETIIRYNVTIPFETWMENSQLILQEDLRGCGDVTQGISDRTVAQHIAAPYVITPVLTYLSPAKEVVESRQDSITSVLYFPDSATEISLDYAQNRPNLTQTATLLADKNHTVTEIRIIGAASPAGEYQFNKELSEERALSLSSYFQSQFHITPRLDNVKWIGEDWSTLLSLVEQSDMECKQQVVEIIKNVGIFAGRKVKLMDLQYGDPYRYMAEHFFPLLRRVSYTIHYQIAAFDVMQGRELILSDPQALSAHEMLLVAESYPQNSKEYQQAIEMTAKRYPDNLIAHINASSLWLQAGNTTAAKQDLEPFEQQPESWNNLGVLYMMEGDYDLASNYLRQAMDRGDMNAVHNMNELNRKRESQ